MPTTHRDYELADVWIQAQPQTFRTEDARNLFVHALASLIPAPEDDREDQAVAVSSDEPASLLILRAGQLYVLSCSSSPDAKPNLAIDCQLVEINHDRVGLCVRQDWIASTDGGVASQAVRHRWSLTVAGRPDLDFVGVHRLTGFGRGPDQAQWLGVALGRILGWEIPGFEMA